MKVVLLLIIGIFIAINCTAKTCKYYDLSRQFNCELTVIDKSDPNHHVYRFDVSLQIFEKNKSDRQIQTISFSTEYLHGTLDNCNHVRSFSTGKNQKTPVIDNDYGNLVIADFNFDRKDDIAIVKDAGGNGGPLYGYYLQNANGTFELDTFLTNKMEFFPDKIDPHNKTLKTLVHANVYQFGEKKFKYNPATRSWKKISFRVVSPK